MIGGTWFAIGLDVGDIDRPNKAQALRSTRIESRDT